MPYLVRGKARDKRNRPPAKPQPPPPPVEIKPEPKVVEEIVPEKLEITYKVPKEQRLLDLPLEDEVFTEDEDLDMDPLQDDEDDDQEYEIQPVGEPVSITENSSIGAMLKKKKKRY
jgi:hypothetical protein